MTLAGDEAQHMRGVLRLKPGDEVFVFDGEGREYRCRIESLRRDEAALTVLEKLEAKSPESPLELVLALGLVKGEKFELVVQKATELGVARIVPVMTKLSDIRLRDERDAARRLTRWRRIAQEAAKQSGRAVVPAVEEPVAFDTLLEDCSPEKDGALCLMFAEREGRGLLEVIEAVTRPPKVTALVGPEGGWADEEISSAQSAGWRVVTLGGRILRAETAAITVAALLQHLCGDLK